MVKNVSCLNTRSVIDYAQRFCPEYSEQLIENLDPTIDILDDKTEFLSDEHNWVSQSVCAEMFRRIREHTRDADIARKIGRESIFNRRFGYVENIFIKAFGHPYLSIIRAPTINEKFNRTKDVEIVEADWSHAVVRLKWFPNLDSTRDICQYNLGVYESIPTIWGLPLGKITEHSCYFDGDEFCEFRLDWSHRNVITMLLGIFRNRRDILRESMRELEREKVITENKYREVEYLNIELKTKVDQLMSLDACSKAVTSVLDSDKVLDIVMSLIVNIMQFDRALIMLVNDDNLSLVPVKATGIDGHSPEELRGYSIPLNRTNNILTRVVNSGIAQIVQDVDHSYLRKENLILKTFNPKSFVALPLITRNKVIGVLAAERFAGLDDFSSNDLDYVMNFCNQIAISLDNAQLLEQMKKSFVSSILSLASALEAKDPYTRGHSNRVATYSTIIARNLGMDEDRVEDIRLMALMHDIGKIGIPDAIINKPKGLTDKEFMSIRHHPLVSMSIVEPLLVNRPELRYIKNHHERYDGLGYPEGLTGRDIPIEGRIMAIADSFDAMTTDRPYRVALTKKEALAEIENNRGTQFCPMIAEAFCRIIESFPEDLYQLVNSPDEETTLPY